MAVGNLCVLRFLCLALLMAMAAATQFRVGGLKGWTVPTDDAGFYGKWAESSRFQIGDSLCKLHGFINSKYESCNYY